MKTATIIIPTYNREEIICDLLLHINSIRFAGIQHNDLEIIIIDQSEAVNKKLEQIAKATSYNIVIKHTNVKNLPYARNLGVECSGKEICIFIDDDVLLDENFVISHIMQYDKMNIGAVAGKILENSKRKNVIGKTPKNMFGYNIFGIAYPNVGGSDEEFVLGFRGCNFSLLRKAFDTVGPFDTNYQGTFIFEETDYAYRLRKKGYKIAFSPDAKVFHLEASSGGCRSRNQIETQYWRFHNAALFSLKNRIIIIFPLIFFTFQLIAVRKALKSNTFVNDFLYLNKAFFKGSFTFFANYGKKY